LRLKESGKGIMSLGWQTESALLPSKAKPIHVDNKSLLSLKAIVLEQEQKQQAKKDSLPNTTQYNRFKTPIISSQTRDKGNSEKEKYVGKSMEGECTSVEYKAQRALEAKAKIYEEMMKKSTSTNSTENFLNPTLVDFSAKNKKDQKETNETDNLEPIKHYPSQPPAEKRAKVTNEYGSNQWQWSTLNPLSAESKPDDVVELWRKEEKDSRDFQRTVDQKIQEEISHGVSQGARIKSQWEKGFDSHTKDILDAIHQETTQLREHQKKDEGNDTQIGVGSKRSLTSMSNNSNSNSNGAVTSREEKLEMIKRKREMLLQQQQQLRK
jgi:hypothetical protein